MPDVRVGVVNAPAISDELTAGLIDDIRGELEVRFPDVRWAFQLFDDGLVEPPAEDSEIVGAARQLLLARAWDLVVVLTDLPLRLARRPVVAHACPMHGVAVLSVPALGTLAVRRRLRDAVLRLISALLGEAGDSGADGRTDAARRRIGSRLASWVPTSRGRRRRSGSRLVCSPATYGCCSAWCGPIVRGSWPLACPGH